MTNKEIAPRIPSDMGVIWPAGYPAPVVYRMVDEWVPQLRLHAARDHATVQVQSGRQIPEAQLLGTEHLLELSPDLAAAIAEDWDKARRARP